MTYIKKHQIQGADTSGDAIDLNSNDNGNQIVARYGLEAAKGNIPGTSIVQIGAINPNNGMEFADVWDAGQFSVLNYDAQTGNFTAGLDITGGTSGATARIVIDDDDGATGTLTLRKIDGMFVDGETITDTSTGSATTDGLPVRVKGMQDPTGAEQWEVVCENVNDTAAGTGSQLLIVTYLHSTTNLYVTEIVATGGHTPVSFAATNQGYPRSALCIAFGAQTPHDTYGKSNLGAIVIRDIATKNIRLAISFDDDVVGDEHGMCLTQSIHYRVPDGKRAFFDFVFTNTLKGEDAQIRSVFKLPTAEGYFVLGENYIYQGVVQEDFSPNPAQDGIPAGGTVKLAARSANSNTRLVAQIILTLEDA